MMGPFVVATPQSGLLPLPSSRGTWKDLPVLCLDIRADHKTYLHCKMSGDGACPQMLTHLLCVATQSLFLEGESIGKVLSTSPGARTVDPERIT